MRALRLLLAVMLSWASALAQVANAPKKSSPTKHPTAVPSKPSSPAPMTDQEKTIYAVGLSISQSLSPLDLSPEEIQIITRALTDAAAGKPEIKLDEWGPKIEPLRQERSARALEKQKAASNAYLEKAASEAGASKTGVRLGVPRNHSW